jgi:hypothetical protein
MEKNIRLKSKHYWEFLKFIASDDAKVRMRDSYTNPYKLNKIE